MASEKEKMAAAETKSPSNKSNCTSPGKKGKHITIRHVPMIYLSVRGDNGPISHLKGWRKRSEDVKGRSDCEPVSISKGLTWM